MMRSKHTGAGFTLLEIMIAVTIMSIGAALMAYGIRQSLTAAKIAEEKTKLAKIGDEIARSFSVNDYANNVACISGYPVQVGGISVATITTFGGASSASNGGVSVPLLHWGAKLSRNRGDIIVGDATTYFASKSQNAPLYELLVNSFGQQRMLFPGPVDESRNQRYVLVSIAANADRGLVIPAPPSGAAQYATWFEALWGTIWDGDQPPPALWGTLLSADEYQRWAGGSERGGSNTGRLLLHKITQKKYAVVLNNNVGNADAQIRVLGETNPVLSVGGLSNVISTLEIPVGRFAIAEVRPTASTGGWSQVQLQHILSETVFTLQVGP